MKSRNLIYIIITIICVIAIILGVYYQITKASKSKDNIGNNQNIIDNGTNGLDDPDKIKDEFNSLFNNTFDDQGYDVSTIKKISGLEEQDVIYSRYDIEQESDEENKKYKIDINLPVFNIDGKVAQDFNRTTQSIFANKAEEILTKSEKYTIYTMDYVAYLNENILSLVIKSTLKEGTSPQRVIVQTYNYNIQTGERVYLNDVLEQKGIDKKEVNNKIEKQVEEANRRINAIAEALAESGQVVYRRDLNNAMYVTDNVNYFFIGLDGQIYILYPYGNSNFTSEIDIIKI